LKEVFEIWDSEELEDLEGSIEIRLIMLTSNLLTAIAGRFRRKYLRKLSKTSSTPSRAMNS
jgi:hypothetical protein